MDMNEEINEILRLAGLPPQLDEAAPSAKRLLPMFQGVIQLAPEGEVRRDVEKLIEREISWARRVLEREDRVVWYLRYIQIGLMYHIAHGYINDYPEMVDDRFSTDMMQMVKNAADKKAKQLAMKAGRTPDEIATVSGQMLRGSTFKDEMVHYMSMPVHAIQNHTFGYELPQEILNLFSEHGKEWAEDQKRVVDAPGPEDGGVILIDFGDGVAWWDLETAYCPQEAACMGHCGNSPRSETDDTILSLRKEFPMQGEMKYSCMLTFIKNENGMLTEMKGRGNDKPAARYHKYIVPLLRHESIEGIIGGGYMPENNFKLGDLEEEGLRQELIDEKPGLAGPTYFIDKAWEQGNYELAARELEELMNEHGLNAPGYVEFDLKNADKGMNQVMVQLDEWENYEAVVREYDDDAPLSLFSLLEEIDDLVISPDNIDESIDEEFLVHVFESLPLGLAVSVARGVGVKPTEDQHKMARGIAKVLDKEREGNRFFEYVVDAAHKAIDASAVNGQIEKIKEEILERLDVYASEGVPMRPYEIYVGPKDENNRVNGPWHMVIGMQELMNILEAGMAGGAEEAWDDESYYAFRQWSSYDGIEPDYDHWGSSDHRGEYGNHPDMKLSNTNEKDKLAADFDEDTMTLAMDQLINNTTAILNQTLRTGITPASDHKKQQELSLEARRREAAFQAELAEIKRLAGFPIV